MKNDMEREELERIWSSLPWADAIPMPTEDVYGWKIKFNHDEDHYGSFFRVFHDGRLKAGLFITDDMYVQPKTDSRFPDGHAVEHLFRKEES